MSEQLQDLIARATVVLRELGAKEIYIFGSAATGGFGDTSDLDLAVSGLPPKAYFKSVTVTMRAVGRNVDIVDLDDESAFVKHLREHGGLQRVF